MNREGTEILAFDMPTLFRKMALPGMVGTLVMGLYNLVDAIFVGQLVGKVGVGAVSLAYPVVLINQAIVALIGIGAMSLLSRSIGNRDDETVRLRSTPDLLRKIAGVGFSAMIMLLLASVQQVVLFRSLAAHGGSDHLILMGATFRVYLFALLPLAGIAQGLQPVLGVSYGAGRYRRVWRAYRFFALAATFLAEALWLSFLVFPKSILGWFITDPVLLATGTTYFRLALGAFFLSGLNTTSMTLFQALGKGRTASLLSFCRQIIFFVPLVLLMPLLIGVNGVWLSVPLAETLGSILAGVLLIAQRRKLSRDDSIDSDPETTLIGSAVSTPAAVPRSDHGIEVDQGKLLNLDTFMSVHIRRALSLAAGRVHGPGGAAELLGINPSTLRNRMKRLGISYGREARRTNSSPQRRT
ncbi:MAG: MATE family efflux transporter [Spirochaetia bacterium]